MSEKKPASGKTPAKAPDPEEHPLPDEQPGNSREALDMGFKLPPDPELAREGDKE